MHTKFWLENLMDSYQLEDTSSMQGFKMDPDGSRQSIFFFLAQNN